ncbi:unnamed protein product [Clavelina lepadiformis]|uniref:Uncharacterized protein n=1 Tax=Clavelina lepadiformis TaxID=159417 RepID=A0ABP0G831_CLALP
MENKNKASTKEKLKKVSTEKSALVRSKDEATKLNNTESGPEDESLSDENAAEELIYPLTSSSAKSVNGVEVLSTSKDNTTSSHLNQEPPPSTVGAFLVKAQFVILSENSVQKKEFKENFPQNIF